MTMNIACATDNNYAPYCGIMLTSLFENNKEHSFSVYILTRGLSEENTTKFNSLASKYHSIITMIELDNDTFKSCPIRENDPVSIVAYYRLALPFVLPQGIQKILYFDVDIIVNKQIDTLYNTDINNVALAACVDLTIDKDVLTKLSLEKIDYFNSGVVLINLDYWRRRQISEQCFDFIEKNPEKITYWDQDALNVILRHVITFMDITNNFQTKYINSSLFETVSDNNRQYILQSAQNPTIIHFSSSDEKPWNKMSDSPYKSFYLYYKRRSLWADSPQIRNYPTLRVYLGWYRRRLETKFGLRESRYIISSIKNHHRQ